MTVSAIENQAATRAAEKLPSPDVLRKTAEQFEAILLMQLTSAMNGSGEPDEDALFGGDGGTDLAKKMFSERLATTMSQSGGVGLADMIMRQFGAGGASAAPGKLNDFSSVAALVKDIKENKDAALTGKTVDQVSAVADEKADRDVSSNSASFMPDSNVLSQTRPRAVLTEALSEIKAAAENAANFAAKTIEKVDFRMPVSGRVSSEFGARFHPVDKRIKLHTGIDIAVPTGTPIGAAADGVVKFAGWKGGYGNTVVVRHADGTETLYAHNQKLLVKEGERILAGERISLSGSTGKSTGPHLHFEVRQNGRVVNPRNFLSNVLPGTADR